jgi:hypothetical protein
MKRQTVPLTQILHLWFYVVLLSDKDLHQLLRHVPQVPNLRPPLFDFSSERALLRLPRLQELGLGRVNPLGNLLKGGSELFKQRAVLGSHDRRCLSFLQLLKQS